MRIHVWPADSKGCGHYRLLFPAQALEAQGADVHVDWRGPTILWDRPWADRPGPDHRILGLAERYEADVVVLQRPGRRWWADLIPCLQAQGTRVVVDVDDDFEEIDKRNTSFGQYKGGVVNSRWVMEACRLADLVTVTTPGLLKRYGFGHGRVLQNLVPETYFNVYGLKVPGSIGWSGFVETHPGDLKMTGGAVAQAIGATDGWHFHCIGTGNGVARDLGLSGMIGATGPVEFGDYPFELARLEVGIVPLADTAFNRAKSWLKAAEMAALGVPFVMSPSPDNLLLHKRGVGLVAESRSQWRSRLMRLMTDDGFRYQQAEGNREAMRAALTYERHCGRWLDAWESVKVKVAA